MKYPKVFVAGKRDLTAGLNRIIGQSALMALYATFDKQTPAELKEARKTGCFRVKGKQTTKRQRVPTQPNGWNKQAPMAPASGRADVLPARGDRLLSGNVPVQHWSIAGEMFAVDMTCVPN